MNIKDYKHNIKNERPFKKANNKMHKNSYYTKNLYPYQYKINSNQNNYNIRRKPDYKYI